MAELSPGSRLARSPLVRPALVAVAALLVMAVFAWLRVDTVGGVDQLPDVGTNHITVPAPLGSVPRGPFGYDGQYFLRLAVEPLPTTAAGHGLVFDEPAYRAQRVGYGAVAWAVTRASPLSAPAALLAVNLAAVTAAAGLGAALARRCGRAPELGLALGVNPVTVQALGRDTAEALALALVVLAVLLLAHRRLPAAGVVLLAAALTRETTVLVVGGLGLAVLVDVVRHRRWPGVPRSLLVAVPTLGWVLWQLYELRTWGELPVAAGDTRTGTPFVALGGALQDAVATGVRADDAAWLAVPLVALVVAALVALPRSRAPLGLRLALLAAVVLLVSLSRAVWVVPAGWMRACLEVVLLSLVVVGASPWRRLLPAVAAGLVLAGLATMPAFVLLEKGT